MKQRQMNIWRWWLIAHDHCTLWKGAMVLSSAVVSWLCNRTSLEAVWPQPVEKESRAVRCQVRGLEMKIRKTKAIAVSRRSWISWWWLMPRKFIKKYNIISAIGGLVGEGQQSARSDNADKNMGNLRHSCLISDSHSPEGRVKSPETAALTSLRHLNKDTKLKFPLYAHQGFCESRVLA